VPLQVQICQRLGKAAFCTEAWASKQLCLMPLVENFGKHCTVQCWRTIRMDVIHLTVCEVSTQFTSALQASLLNSMNTACKLLVLTTH